MRFARLSLLGIFVSMLPLASGVTSVQQQDLFTAGEGGYARYRIPAIVVTPQHTVLVACEARKTGRGDWDHVDLWFRRSLDDGKTWQPARELVGQQDLPADLQRNPAAVAAQLGRDGVYTINNPTWIADSPTGETHLLYCVEYARAFIITTSDGGASFNAPREITRAFETFRTRDDYDWQVIAIGPGHGIRMANGRLVVTVWLSTGEGGHAHRPSICATLFSDDLGATWQAGEVVARDPTPLINPSETAIVEVTPGRVMLNIRSESDQNRRAVAWSADGTTHWTRPAFHDELMEPVCMAGLVAFPHGDPEQMPLLLFSNPASLEPNPALPPSTPSRRRQNLTLRASRDGGHTWPARIVLEPGPSAYSDLAVTADGTILCWYERGEGSPYEKLTLARLPIDLLMAKER
jgi:sialidase-1